MMLKFVSVLSTIAVCAGIAHAQTVVYEQSPSSSMLTGTLATINHLNDQKIADDFTLETIASITEIKWWGFVYDSRTQAKSDLDGLTSFVIQFYEANGVSSLGLPEFPDETVWAGQTIEIASVAASSFGTTGSVFEYSALLNPPVVLNSGTKYWIAINARIPAMNEEDERAPYFLWLYQDARGDGIIAGDGVATEPLDGVWESVSIGSAAGASFSLATGLVVDSDSDGLSDADEAIYGTDPDNPDTDADGLLDGTEVDLAAAGGCHDPLNPDSDGDTLLDGYEVAIGTDPCNTDTDGDGFPDAIDQDPTVPSNTMSDFEYAARFVADEITATDSILFTGRNANASKGRRNSLSTRVHNAANAIADGDYATAAALLDGVYIRLDGDPQPNDWMEPSDEKDLLADYVLLLLTIALEG